MLLHFNYENVDLIVFWMQQIVNKILCTWSQTLEHEFSV